MTRNLRRTVPWVHLAVESLESREGPSSLADPLAVIVTFPDYAYVRLEGNPQVNIPRGAAPVVTEARGICGESGLVTIGGAAIDDKTLAGCLITIRGDGVNETAIVDANGKFSVTFQRPTNADFTVKVTVVDSDGNVSESIVVLVSGI